jgi:hypothetical protein
MPHQKEGGLIFTKQVTETVPVKNLFDEISADTSIPELSGSFLS